MPDAVCRAYRFPVLGRRAPLLLKRWLGVHRTWLVET